MASAAHDALPFGNPQVRCQPFRTTPRARIATNQGSTRGFIEPSSRRTANRPPARHARTAPRASLAQTSLRTGRRVTRLCERQTAPFHPALALRQPIEQVTAQAVRPLGLGSGEITALLWIVHQIEERIRFVRLPDEFLAPRPDHLTPHVEHRRATDLA